MSNPTLDPWEVAQTQSAPATASTQMDPWDVASSQLGKPVTNPNPSPSGESSGDFERSPNYPNAQMTDPTANDAMTAYGVGKLAIQGIPAIARGAASLFEVPESLKSAGITENTLKHMIPEGQDPGDYVNLVENQLTNDGVLASNGRDTWKNIALKMQSMGDAIKNDTGIIKQASLASGTDATLVDAKTALDPIANEALKRGLGNLSKTETLANPFYDTFDGLMKTAQSQGGQLSLDNIKEAMEETGDRIDEAGPGTEVVLKKLYGKLANVWDGMVQTVANQATTPEAKQAASDLLKNNAGYSTYMQLQGSVASKAMKEGLQEGISAYQKYVGPIGSKVAVGYGGARLIGDAISTLWKHANSQ